MSEIQENLVYLTKHLTNLNDILLHLEQGNIFSTNECEEISNGNTAEQRNYKLLNLIQKKDWDCIRNLFLEILRKTNNPHCASVIEGIQWQPRNTTIPHPKLSKWWPDKKQLIKSLHKRKIDSRLLVEELHDRISKDENRMVVITESADASKYSGMGGVGKTLTTKWYGHHYEEEYDHILWIDCGEGSLLKSFQKLARDLKVEDRNELLDLEDYSRKSYKELEKWKCLWIYDNAESYKGDEGIIKILPVEKLSFSCLITSRSREWGVINVEYGKITDLQLDIFSEGESLEFLKERLDKKINYEEFQLKELCSLLGNLPLAMELALSALNSRRIDLNSYIKKTHQKDLAFVGPTFDDYEKTINKNIKISLDMMLEEKNGNLAIEILMIFGYIRPDDIPGEFIQQIVNSEEIEPAIELLVKYCLISKEGKSTQDDSDNDESIGKEIKMVLSIHRLLQQVIRHNGRKKERATLKKILDCHGFAEYKLIPFTKYADEELRKEFPKVRAELLDQQQLQKLMWERKFEESVLLAKFIHDEIKTNTTKFNYAICLDKNGQLEECLKMLEDLDKQEMEEEGNYFNSVQMGILSLKEKISRDLVVGHLLVVYWRMENKKRIQQILEQRIQFKVIHSDESLGSLIRIVNSDLTTRNYSLTKEGSFIELNLNVTTKKIELSDCLLSLSSFDRFSSEELTLVGVSFTRDGRELKHVTVNNFIDFNNVKRLRLKCGSKNNMRIDLSGDVSMDYVELFGVKVLDWKLASWNVPKLELGNISFVEKTKLEVKDMKFGGFSSLDISCLPRKIQQLTLGDKTKEVFASGGIDFPLLTHLTLFGMDRSFSSSPFKSVQLTHLHLYEIKYLNLLDLPTSVSQLKITCAKCGTRIYGEGRKLDKVILQGFPFFGVKDCLRYLQTDNLVIHHQNRYGDVFSLSELLELMKKEIKTIAVGKIKWGKDFESVSSHVDRKANYYLLEGGRGRGMDEKEFEELLKLY